MFNNYKWIYEIPYVDVLWINNETQTITLEFLTPDFLYVKRFECTMEMLSNMNPESLKQMYNRELDEFYNGVKNVT